MTASPDLGDEAPAALVVVGTPIGNLGDLSPRAAAELARADAIACEDTRRTGRLLALQGIAAPRLLLVNEHTEAARAGDVVARIARGERVVLASDAGMPVVSDPGRRLVGAVAEAGLPVEVVPGPSAVVAALAVSGFAGDRFVFEGFLPRKGRARRDRLTELASEPRTVVLYEAPPRLRATIAGLVEACGPQRRAVVARELTKLHEEVLRGTLSELLARLGPDGPKGELVVVVEGRTRPPGPLPDDAVIDALRAAMDQGQSTRDAVAEVVDRTGEPKRRVYDLAIGLGEETGP